MKRNLPHVLLIIVFCCLFILTQKLETKSLYFGFGDPGSGDVYHNHKTSIQINVFVYALAISLTIISFLKVVKEGYPRMNVRILLNLISISIIYFVNYYLSKLFYSEGFNIYYDWRHNRGFELAIFTILINLAMVLIVNFLTNLTTKNGLNRQIK